MKKYFNQIIVIPIIALYYLIGLFVFNRFNISIDYLVYGLFIVGGLIYKFIINEFRNNKLIRIICSSLVIIIVLSIYLKTASELLHGIYLGITNGNIFFIKESISKISISELLKYSLHLFSFVLIAILYDDLIVKKKISIFAYFALLLSVIGGILQGEIDFIVLGIFILSLLLIVFKDSYYDINKLDYSKSLIIILIFACCIISSYFLIPYAENVNIREGIINIKSNCDDFIDNLFNGNELSLDGNLLDMKLSSDKQDLSEEIVLTIDTSYHVDKIKAYSCSIFDINKNSFVIDKEITKNKQEDYTDLYIKQDGKPLSEYFHVFVNKNIDDVVYVPYGVLSFTEKVDLYNDLLIQFHKNSNYHDYSLTFNPYYDNLVSNVSLFSKYKEYVNNNYAKKEQIPDEILSSINKFINEDSELYYLNDNNQSNNVRTDEDRKDVIARINEYVNTKFTVSEDYRKNNEKINDISYALENEHIANPQLLAAILTFMYRNEGIPSRYVVGYKANDYQENTVYIHENDKTYWSEVFIDGHWVPAENNYLFIENEGSVIDTENKIGSMDGNIDDNYDDFSNVNDEEPDSIVLSVESSYSIDRIKQTSYGDYNPIDQKFEYEENINSFPSIQKIKLINELDDYFNELFISDSKYKYFMKITSYIDTNNAYVPYGSLNIQNVSMYQDKAVLLNNEEDSYLINFEPYNKDNEYKSNSFYEEYVHEKYLTVPNEMEKNLQEFLLSRGIDYKAKDKSLIIRQVKNLLQSKEYTYTLKPGRVPDNEDVLMYFLIKNKKGFCQHFAGAATLLYRVCGIPARYTVGFAIDDFKNGVANLTAQDAHAWVEVYTNNYGWKPIEVTGSKKYDTSENETDYIFNGLDSDTIGNTENNNQENAKYNTQPDYALEKQTLEQNKTYIKEDDYENGNQTLFTVECNDDINRIKRYSLGNYNISNQKFFLGEDISSRKEIIKINKLYDIDLFFKSLFIVDEELENKMNIKIFNDEKWLYVPYGAINVENASIYQDKYMYFDDEREYDDYSLSYSLEGINRNINQMYDYENFVYNYYTDIPHDFEYLLKDYLDGLQIDYNSEDKLLNINKIQDFLMNKYILKNNVKDSKDDVDSVINFIIRTREGTDELFANGATMLLRICGIPARVANGYYLDKYDEGVYAVTSTDEHSWVEVYTSNYGWMPVEVCPNYDKENIETYEFERHYNEEDYIEFVDIEKRNESKLYLIVSGFIAFVSTIIVVIIEIKKKRDEYNKKLLELGITTKEQLRLLKNINKYYLLLKNNGYVNDEIEQIMLRIRFSTHMETEKDLKMILDRVDYMKKDVRSKWLYKINKH